MLAGPDPAGQLSHAGWSRWGAASVVRGFAVPGGGDITGTRIKDFSMSTADSSSTDDALHGPDARTHQPRRTTDIASVAASIPGPSFGLAVSLTAAPRRAIHRPPQLVGFR